MSVLSPTPEAIEAAARVIREGGVVVIPTETVYGLAANALNADAVQKIYEIKGRPAENPLIVHIASVDQLRSVAREWPPLAEQLAEAFWPGPLTMVLPKKADVPQVTTGMKDTVAVRIPSHPIALDVIRATGVPIAAPSANVFMGLSPTRADDIDPEIDIEVPIILDGGPCAVGLESTVVDLTDETPRILRPGAVTRAQIQALVGKPLGEIPSSDVRAPGMYRRHYAPKATVRLVDKLEEGQAGLTFEPSTSSDQITMPRDPKAYGVLLYGVLRRLDLAGVSTIHVQRPPSDAAWEAVQDRLQKASASLA